MVASTEVRRARGTRWSGALGAIVLGGVLAAALLPAPALGDTEQGETGRVGPHLLIDTPSSPGARCDYSVVAGGLRFAQMEVQPPVVYPVAGRAKQKVAWAVRLQMKRTGSAWKTKLQTEWFARRASADAPASFESTWVSWSTSGAVRWRAQVLMEWRAAGVAVGASRHRVDSYGIGASMDVNTGGCQNLIPDPTHLRPAMEPS